MTAPMLALVNAVATETLAVTEGWPWWGKALFAVLVLIAIVAVVKAFASRL